MAYVACLKKKKICSTGQNTFLKRYFQRKHLVISTANQMRSLFLNILLCTGNNLKDLQCVLQAILIYHLELLCINSNDYSKYLILEILG